MRQPLRTRRRHDRIASTDRRRHAGLLLAGFLAVTVAILVAHRAPASAYELSVYAATPLAFWVGVAVAFAAAIAVAFASPAGVYRAGALVLGGEAFVAVVSLPVIRGYEFYSAGDALSHMGWIRNVLRGELGLLNLIYPGLHSVAIFLHRLMGLELAQSMQLAVVVFSLAFVVFVPLVAAVLTDSTFAVPVGTFSAMLLLPINNISAHFVFFPSTMAVFLFPFVLLLAVVAITDVVDARVSPVDALLALGTVGVLFVHPQQAVNLLLVFVMVSVGLLVFRLRTGDRSVAPLYGHTALLAALLVTWAVVHERIMETATAYAGAVISGLFAGNTARGGAITQRTGSLAEIGVSPLEIGMKLFLPGLVFAVLAALVLSSSFVRSLRRDTDSIVLTVVGLGLVPVGVVMVLYVLGNLQTIYFRHLGFIMALVTVFGAVALIHGLEGSATRGFDRGALALTGFVVALLLVLSLATVFPSPFIHQPNSQVTEARFSGHATAFAHENPEIEYVGIRTGPDRFRDAIEGTFDLSSRAERREARVPFGELDGDLTETFDGPRYLVVSRADAQRETVAYQNIRYSDEGFIRLGTGGGVNRVVSNGEFRLYYVAE